MDSLDAIKNQINAGDQQGARLALQQRLTTEPDNTEAWALLAILLADPAEKAECYRQILRVNPADRHAAAWLEALEPEVRRSPVDSTLATSQPDDASASKPVPEEADLDRLLEELDLPRCEGRSTAQPIDDETDRDLREDIPRWPETQPKRRGFLARIIGRRPRARPEDGSRTSSLDEGDVAVQPGSLNPADILRMAGGPLPAEERRKCQECGAVVSRKESRCPWCSASLTDTGEG